MAADDYNAATARVYLGDLRLIHQLQIDLTPSFKRRPSVAEVIHAAMQKFTEGRITSG